MLGHKTVRKGLWNRLTMQGGVDPMLALAISYACYPSPNQPHSLQPLVTGPEAWQVTESFLDRHSIDLDACCNRLFGKDAEETIEAMVDDERLGMAGSATFHALLKR